MWMGQGADTLSVGCVLVRVLFQTVKHLFLAAKQWQFVPELWREVGPRQRGKGLTRSRSAQRGCRGTDACLSLCLGVGSWNDLARSGGSFSCEVACTKIHKNFLGNGALPC